jgi:antitoxin MazE
MLGLHEGACVSVQLAIDGGLRIRHATWSRREFVAELNAARAELPLGNSVMQELRRSDRY